MKYSIPTLMELSQESGVCRWTVDSKYCRRLQPHRCQSPALSEHIPNRLVEETTGKSLSSQLAKPSTAKSRLIFRQRRKGKSPPVAPIPTEDSGFACFLRAHSSPLHQRVTAGGRIVPMDLFDGPAPVESRRVPVGGFSPAAVQNPSHNWENAPHLMINEVTMDVQSSEPGLGTVGAQVNEHWGSQSTTPVDSPTRPAYARLPAPSSLEDDGQYAQLNSRHDVFVHGDYRQSFPPGVFPGVSQPLDHTDPLYANLNLNTNSFAIRRMSPDQLFRLLFPMTAMHTALPPNHSYLSAWMRSDNHRTEMWRGFIESLVEEAIGNSNWVDGLQRDLLALSDPIDRIIRELDQTIARTLETRPRDRDMRVLYINMRQVVQEAWERLQRIFIRAPYPAPHTTPSIAPGVSPLHLHTPFASTGIPLYQFSHAPPSGSLMYRPQHISRDLINASVGAHVNGIEVGTQTNEMEPLLFGEPASNYGAVENFRRVWIPDNSGTFEAGTFYASSFDAANTQVDVTQVTGTYLDGNWVHGIYDDGIEVNIFDGLIARMTEIPSNIGAQGQMEREQGHSDEHLSAPPRSLDNLGEEYQQMMDETAIERLRAAWPSPKESEGEESDDVENSGSEGGSSSSANDCDYESSRESSGGEDSTGNDIEFGDSPNSEPGLSDEDQDERSHCGISDRDDVIGAGVSVYASQNDNDVMSQVILLMNIPQHQIVVQLSTTNARGEITQPGGHQHHEADTSILVLDTAQAGRTGSVWMRVMRACIQAFSRCVSLRER